MVKNRGVLATCKGGARCLTRTLMFNPHTNCVIGAGIQSKKREDPSLGSLAVKSSLSVCVSSLPSG